ncbi:MAG: roadblock/LC7 domain-containing protein [Acidobacteriota bacterium]|nr:roadblock/LC7 domain-containing protein [Acidobacteriota bacterium]MDH3784878.1 roadblock/LC7 domain-containing protein [Acidobacteriota bacterium]
MSGSNLVIHEEDHTTFVDLLDELREVSNARFIFLIDKNGQQLASVGEVETLDPTALASLTAGNVAATEGLAEMIGEGSFTTLYHEGEKDNLHISLIAEKMILLLIFDERSSLGLVRLRVSQHAETLATAVGEVLGRDQQESAGVGSSQESFSEITDDDIDALFG